MSSKIHLQSEGSMHSMITVSSIEWIEMLTWARKWHGGDASEQLLWLPPVSTVGCQQLKGMGHGSWPSQTGPHLTHNASGRGIQRQATSCQYSLEKVMITLNAPKEFKAKDCTNTVTDYKGVWTLHIPAQSQYLKPATHCSFQTWWMLKHQSLQMSSMG